jgi:ligand-binding sensor domain-containing protein
MKKTTFLLSERVRKAVAATAALVLVSAGAPGASAQDQAPAPHAAGGPEASLRGLRDIINFDMGARNVKDILIDGRIVWLGTSNGLIKYDAFTGATKTYNNRNGLFSNGVFHISRVGDDMWIGTYGGGLTIMNLKTEAMRHYNIQHGMGDAFIYDVLNMPNGDVWLATWSGANLIKGGALDDVSAWTTFTVKNTNGGLPNDWVYGMAPGKNGEVWFATEGGLARYINGKWDNWTHAAGLAADYDIVKNDIDYDNDPGKISSHHARQKQEQGIADIKVAYNPNYVVALNVDNDGAVWAGSWGGGLSRFDGKTFTIYTVADGLPGNHVGSIEVLEDGRLLIGGNRGVAVFDGETFKGIDVHAGIQTNRIFSLDAAQGEVWIGGYGGASRLPNGVDAVLAKQEERP